MAELSKHYVYNKSWTSYDSLMTSSTALGPYDGGSKQRSVFKITLNSINSNQKRTTLTVNLKTATVPTTSPSFYDSLHYSLTNSGKGSSYTVEGDEYDSGDTESFESYAVNATSTTPAVYYNRTSTFKLDVSGVPSGTNTVYLWVYANCSIGGRYASYTTIEISFSEGNPTTVAPSKTNVTTGSINTATGGFYKPTQPITLSWSAGSNGIGGITVSGYKARIGYTKDDGSVVHFTLKDKTTNLSATLDIQNVPRGKSITAGVKAFGSEEGYDGSWKDITLGKINNPPKITKVASTGTKITDDDSITFTANIASGDSNQTAYLEYDLNGRGWERIESGSELEIDKNFSGLNTTNSNNTIKFQVNDGVETAQYSETFNFVTSYKPVLSNPRVSFSQLKNMQDSVDSYLTKFVNGTYTSSGSVNIKAEIITNTSSSVSETGLTPQDVSSAIIVSNSNTFQLDVTKLSTLVLPYGNYFKFRFAVTNAEGSSGYTQWYGPKRRPYQPSLPINCTASNRATNPHGTSADSNYFESKIGITATNPTSKDGCAKISSISLILNNNTQQPLSWNSSITSEQTVEYIIGDEINNGTAASFVFIVSNS